MRVPLFAFVVVLSMVGCAAQYDTRDNHSERESVTDADSAYPIYLAAKPLEDLAATSANASIGDLNGDGNLDILLVKGRHWPLEDRILFGDGIGGFAATVNLRDVADRSYAGLLADLDVDGDLDIVMSNDRPDPILVYLNDGNGVFAVASTVGKAEWPTRNADVADMNGDGLLDVIVANRFRGDTDGNYICINQGNGLFGDDCVRFSTEASTTITPADMDEDGLLDLVVPHRNGGQSFVYMQASNTDMQFRRVPFGPSDAVIRATEVGDFDGDGLLDIVAINAGRSEGDDGEAANRYQLASVAMFFGQTDGSYSAPKPIGDAKAVPYALAGGDLNSDGALDILVGYVEAPSIVFYNKGSDSGFSPVQFGDGEGTVYGFAIGDLNKDGQPDIVAARSGAINVVYFGRAKHL